MDINGFIDNFAAQFDDTPADQIKAETHFRDLVKSPIKAGFRLESGYWVSLAIYTNIVGVMGMGYGEKKQKMLD